MKSRVQSFVHSWAQLFGFFALALVISTADCRTRVKAQEPDDDGVVVVGSKWCNREYYIATYGEPDWHWWWGVHMCWLYTGEPEPLTVIVVTGNPEPPKPAKRPVRKFVIGGR